MALVELVQGARVVQSGATAPGTSGRTGAQRVQAAHSSYAQMVQEGNVYHAQTAASGVAPGTSIGTTGAFGLYNPRGSGVYLEVLIGQMGYLSGTLGAGLVHWIAHQSPAQAAFTGTAITPINAQIGNQSTGKGLPTTTTTVPASGLGCRILGCLGASLASTAAAPWQITDYVDGAILIAPGGGVSLQGTTAAGSTPLVIFSVTWNEVPV